MRPDFECLVAFCAQQMNKTAISALLPIACDTVRSIVARVSPTTRRRPARRPVTAGVDEISHRRGQRYLTQVCDHTTGRIVWVRPGGDAATLQAFFDDLGADGRASIRAKAST